MDIPTPSHDHSVGAAVAFAVSKLADIVKATIRRKAKADQDALFLRMSEKFETGMSQIRDMLNGQNVVLTAQSGDLREFRVRLEGVMERVSKVELAVATLRGEK